MKISITAALLLSGVCFTSASAQRPAIPNFMPQPGAGWVAGVPNGVSPTGQDYLPPESGPGPITFDKAHPYIDDAAARRDNKQPTYRVADLSNPILLPWTREALRKVNEKALSGKAMMTPKERCWPIGVPGWVLYPVRPVYFLQFPKEIVMVWTEDNLVRHIYLDVPHSAHPKPSWFGESVGHYEGDELVIDTIGLNDKTFVDSYRTPHTDKLHVVERYRMADGGKLLDVNVHVEDPGAFAMAWSARQQYHLETQPRWDEQVCAENNASWFGLDVGPIPTAANPDF